MTQKRRIVGISTLEYNPVGARTLYLVPTARQAMMRGTRRATRTPTLDGAAIVYDAGFSYSDMTWQISIMSQSPTDEAFMRMLVMTYNLVRISTVDGVFDAVPASWNNVDGIVTLEAWVMEQVA